MSKDFSGTLLVQSINHFVGRKIQDEKLVLSHKVTDINQNSNVSKSLQMKMFLLPFSKKTKQDVRFKTLANNVFNSIDSFFSGSISFISLSQNLAKELYEKIGTPHFRGGHLVVSEFKDIVLNDEVVRGLGIFLYGEKTTYANITEEKFEFLQGISIDGLSAGCIVYNTDQEEGYQISVLNNTKKSYWEDFLQIQPIKNNHFQTMNQLTMLDTWFAENVRANKSPLELAEIKNKTISFFENNNEFNEVKFLETLENPEIKDFYKEAKQDYENMNDILLERNFEIDKKAVKTEKKRFKSILKLDNNFHIYIHGDRSLIQQGYDENTKKNYYKVFFDVEN